MFYRHSKTSRVPVILHFVDRNYSVLKKDLRQFDEGKKHRMFFYEDPGQLFGMMNLPKWQGRGMQLYLMRWETLKDLHPSDPAGITKRLARWIRTEHIIWYADSKNQKDASKALEPYSSEIVVRNANFFHRLENAIKKRQSRFVFLKLRRQMVMLSLVFLFLLLIIMFVLFFV